jgi:hypothetical protein
MPARHTHFQYWILARRDGCEQISNNEIFLRNSGIDISEKQWDK